MRRIKAVIIDDEISAIQSLRGMLAEFCPQVSILQAAATVDQGVKAVRQYEPDVVFLDIEMSPTETGFDFIQRTEDLQYGVIFTTAYPQYSIRAINEAQPWAYLVKPYKSADLIQAIHVATLKTAVPPSTAQHPHRGIILADMRKGNVVIRFNDLVYCQADGPCTIFYFYRDGRLERHVAYKSLKETETEVPDAFFCRVHHSFIVNMAYVRRFERNGRAGRIHLPNDTQIDVSVQKMEAFSQHFHLFLTGYDKRVNATPKR